MSSSTLVYYATPLRRHLEQAKPAAAPVAAAAKPAPANPSNLTKATTAQAPKHTTNTTAASVGRTVSVPKTSKMDVKTADPALVKMLNTTQLGAGARVTERVRASAAQRRPPA
jgi:hypothetical protein